jgi:hypothetical protein
LEINIRGSNCHFAAFAAKTHAFCHFGEIHISKFLSHSPHVGKSTNGTGWPFSPYIITLINMGDYGMMFFNMRLRMMLVITVAAVGAALAQEPIPAATALPKIAVYVFGAKDPALNKAMATRLITALLGSGRYQAAGGYRDFFERMAEEQKSGETSLDYEQVNWFGKQFGAEYVCVAEIAAVFGENQASAYILDVETAEVKATGASDVALKTATDLTGAAEQIVERMFKGAAPPVAVAVTPATQSETSTADTPTATVNVAGEAKVVVDMVVAAVNAFKDATKKSLDAANAVKTAAQSKNFSAIMDAKKKVQSAVEAVKQAKADVTTAIDALKTAGPEAEAAVKAMGIDISMFAGKGGDEREGGKVKKTDFYFSPKYQFPVGTPVIWGGVSAEIGWIGENEFLLGIDFDFGYWDAIMIGGGFSFGKAHDLGNRLQIAYGGSVGFWLSSDGYSETSRLAPFVKLRLNNVEIMYRGLLGINTYGDFGWNNHQLMLGYHFQTSRRTKK